MHNVVQLEIIFFSCVDETTLFTFLRENSTSLRFPGIFIKQKLGDRMIKQLQNSVIGYRLSLSR